MTWWLLYSSQQVDAIERVDGGASGEGHRAGTEVKVRRIGRTAIISWTPAVIYEICNGDPALAKRRGTAGGMRLEHLHPG